MVEEACLEFRLRKIDETRNYKKLLVEFLHLLHWFVFLVVLRVLQ